MTHRAYALLEIKSTGERDGKRVFSGIASTPTPDSYEDVVESMGAEFKTPMPLLWQHDAKDPIGWMNFAKPTAKGIPFEAEVATIEDDGKEGTRELIRRIDKAWAYLKNKLVRGVSIGFQPLEWERIEHSNGYRYTKWKWLELSAVTIPANADASIMAIKSADRGLVRARAALSGNPSSLPVGGTGSQRTNMKTVQELMDDRATKQARLSELRELRTAESRRFTAEEAGEFDTLMDEVDDLEDQIRMKNFDDRMAARATPVSKAAGSGARVPGGMTLVRKEDPDDEFKGQGFTRLCIARALAWMEMQGGNFVSPADIAKYRWGKTHPKLVQFIVAKTAVAGGGTGSGEWGAELAQSDRRYDGDFVDYLMGMTVYDRLPLTPAPGRVHVKGQDGQATGYWVGESKAIPFSKLDFSDVELLPLKVGALSGVSKELIRAPGSGAERLIRDGLAKASAKRVDDTFLSNTAASSGVSPAGIANGISAVAPSGADAAAVRTDLMTLYLPFLTAKNASGLVQIMTPSMAKAISLMVNANGVKEFPLLKASGGELEGDPVYTGDNVTGGDWFLIKPEDIWKIDETGVEVSMSDTATIEQNDAPQGAQDTPTAASATIMSAWQTESVFFKIVRPISFKLRRASAVNWLQNGEYGGVAS